MRFKTTPDYIRECDQTTTTILHPWLFCTFIVEIKISNLKSYMYYIQSRRITVSTSCFTRNGRRVALLFSLPLYVPQYNNQFLTSLTQYLSESSARTNLRGWKRASSLPRFIRKPSSVPDKQLGRSSRLNSSRRYLAQIHSSSRGLEQRNNTQA